MNARAAYWWETKDAGEGGCASERQIQAVRNRLNNDTKLKAKS
jgi:hypothetical protein